MRQTFLKISTVLLTIFFVVAPMISQAETATGRLEKVGAGNGGSYASQTKIGFSTILGTVVQAALGLLGVIFIALMVYAGFTYMQAQGDEQKVEKALATIRYAITGLVIVLSSYAFWKFIASRLLGIS